MVTLRDLRKQANKSCAEVAKELGITPQAFYRYERGIRQISLEQIVQLAKIYDVEIADIVFAAINSQSDR